MYAVVSYKYFEGVRRSDPYIFLASIARTRWGAWKRFYRFTRWTAKLPGVGKGRASKASLKFHLGAEVRRVRVKDACLSCQFELDPEIWCPELYAVYPAPDSAPAKAEKLREELPTIPGDADE